MALRRLQKELQFMQEHPDTEFDAEPDKNENLLRWNAVIKGPAGTPYEGGSFLITISMTASYPFAPPKFRFRTPIYHPNISSDGRICLDILNKSWSPALTISKVLMSVLSLLSDPNADDPLVFRIAQLYRNDRDSYLRQAKNWTEKYAKERNKNVT